MVETGSVQHKAPLHLAISRCNNSDIIILDFSASHPPYRAASFSDPSRFQFQAPFQSPHCSHLHHIWALIIFNFPELVLAIVKLSSICCEAGFVKQPIV